MIRSIRNALFPHDIAQATSGGRIFTAYEKYAAFKHFPPIYTKKFTVNFFFLDTQYERRIKEALTIKKHRTNHGQGQEAIQS